MLSGIPAAKAGAGSPAVIEVSEANFEREVVVRSRQVPVVVDFWAPWCGPCRSLGPILERLAAEAQGAWVLAKLNTDENQRLAQMFRIQSIPAVKAIKDGKIVDEFVGALPESQVRAWLKRFVGAPGASALDQIRALEDQDPEGAAARYRLLLGEEPENDGALLALGRLLLLRGEAEGPAALRQIPGSSPHFARAQAMLPLAEFLAAPAAARGAASESEAGFRRAAAAARQADFAAAMDELLTIVARDRAFRDDGARKALLSLFAALGDDHALVPAYRRRLANTLF